MQGSKVYGAVAHINTIYRCIYYFGTSGCKTVQHGSVTEMFNIAVFALQKQEKFLKYIGRQSWPREMHTLRDSLLLTPVMNAELCENQGVETMSCCQFSNLMKDICPHMQIY